jgi:late competence protein required for DNA uptake (superfamily II DNA/RNA helicase)
VFNYKSNSFKKSRDLTTCFDDEAKYFTPDELSQFQQFSDLIIDGLGLPCGSGKTHLITKTSARLFDAGGIVLIAQPTINLIGKTIGEMRKRFPHVVCVAVHGRKSRKIL